MPVDRQVRNPAPVVPSSVAPATTSPVPPAPPPARVESIRSYINSITLSNQTLSYPPSSPGTAEERAVQWLIEDDLNTATEDSVALCQRYALSTPWFTGDSQADTWITNQDECAWSNV
jgi:hypothetical protein